MDAFLDTNILARFIVGDVESQQPAVQKLFHDGNELQLQYCVIPEIFAELNYVLISHYGFSKDQVVGSIREVLDLGFIEVLTKYQLDFDKVCDLHQETNLSFEDCLYLQICLENNIKLLTFDTKLAKVYEDMIKA
jgi:predicted nucleic acid-binding protein